MKGVLNGMALCAGVGGLELGIHLAVRDYRTVCYIEREAHAAASLVAGMESQALDRAPIWDDLKTFDGANWRGVVDIISGGYPCQPFSCAGKRQGSEDPRHLWPTIAGIVSEVSPRWCFFENVPGHLSLGFEEVIQDLEALGYCVAAGLFSAEEIGAPHRRERLFILGNTGEPRTHADAASGGCEREPAQGCSGESSGQLADPAHQLRHWPRDAGARRRAESTNGRAFPPGPAADWGQLADAANVRGEAEQRGESDGIGRSVGIPRDLWPALPQSEIRGMADGSAGRVDRLRACGNAVVPIVAAYALSTLAAALKLDT